MKEKKKEEKKMQTDGGVDPNWRWICSNWAHLKEAFFDFSGLYAHGWLRVHGGLRDLAIRWISLARGRHKRWGLWYSLECGDHLNM